MVEIYSSFYGYPNIRCCSFIYSLAFGVLGNSEAIHVLQLLVCSMLIPARMLLRGAMGIRTSMGMEMAGIATMMGAMSFARSAIGGPQDLQLELVEELPEERMISPWLK